MSVLLLLFEVSHILIVFRFGNFQFDVDGSSFMFFSHPVISKSLLTKKFSSFIPDFSKADVFIVSIFTGKFSLVKLVQFLKQDLEIHLRLLGKFICFNCTQSSKPPYCISVSLEYGGKTTFVKFSQSLKAFTFIISRLSGK